MHVSERCLSMHVASARVWRCLGRVWTSADVSEGTKLGDGACVPMGVCWELWG